MTRVVAICLAALFLGFPGDAAANNDAELMLALRGMHPQGSGVPRHELVRRILKRNPKAIEEATSATSGPLLVAIRYHDAKVVKVLLDHGADANRPVDRETVLFAAVQEKQTAIVDLLLSKGARVRQRDFVLATNLGQTKSMEMLLSRGASVDAPDDSNTPPVLAATEANQVAALGFLLGRGARVHTLDARRQPLPMAAKLGHTEIARLLLDHGAPVESKHRAGLRPALWAVLFGHEDVLRLLVARGATMTPFVLAALGDHYRLGSRKDLPTLRIEGETLLHAAARFGRRASVKALLEAKVDPRIGPPMRGTPLLLAARHGDLEMVRALLAHGADVNAADSAGRTALHIAAGGGRALFGQADGAHASRDESRFVELLQFLLEKGANLEAALAKDLYVGSRWRPLHFALMHKRLDLATALIRAGAKTSWDDKHLHSLNEDHRALLAQAIAAATR